VQKLSDFVPEGLHNSSQVRSTWDTFKKSDLLPAGRLIARIGPTAANGWSVGASPNITANWLSKKGQQWTVPIGGGIEEVVRLGGQRMKLSVDAYYNAIRPTAGNDTALVQVTLTLLFPP
jgi:hypothetical protein